MKISKDSRMTPCYTISNPKVETFFYQILMNFDRQFVFCLRTPVFALWDPYFLVCDHHSLALIAIPHSSESALNWVLL